MTSAYAPRPMPWQSQRRQPAAARVGAVVTPTFRANEDEFRSYLKTIDDAMEGLWADVRAQLVWIDPADVSKWGSGPKLDELQARAKAHGPTRSAAEIEYSKTVYKLRSDWQEAKIGLTVGMDDPLSPVPASTIATYTKRWNDTRPWHSRLRDKVDDFRELGGVPSVGTDPGPVPEEIVASPGELVKKGASIVPWWVWPAVIVVGGAVVYVYAAPLLAVRKAVT